MHKETLSVVLEELAVEAPDLELLTGKEEIFIYSHYGVFGSNRVNNVIGVLRNTSQLNKQRMTQIEKELGLRFLSNTVIDGWTSSENVPFIILDEKTYLEQDKLAEYIKKRKAESDEIKKQLSEDQPFKFWILDRVKSETGYRLKTEGYCITQKEYDGLETYSAKGRTLICKGLLSGELECSKKAVDILYTCTACGQCYDEVKGRVDEIRNAVLKGRNKVAETAGYPDPLRTPIEKITKLNNPMGLPAEDKPLWYEDIAEDHPYKDKSIIYWAGCSASYRLPEIIESATMIMEKQELEFGLMGEEEPCCGLLLYLAGAWKEAANHALEVVKKLKEINCIITGCSGCFYMFNKLYPKLGVQPHFRVMHTSQLLENLTESNKIKFAEAEGRYMWHDPCDLGRHCGVYDPPRNVLNKIPGLKLVEPALTRNHTQCCGGGGGIMFYDYNLSLKLARSKYINDIEPLKVDAVITGCPTCIINLKTQTADEKIMDISQITSKYIE